ncbi:hypothetical protein ACQRC6_06200 [Peptoniphilus sp. SGI.035]|uniref:hypothetical protein n=1 Tax=Peptoniphilus sp. SGI.035 TaxID=3420564 RepID=UPI003D08747A
MKLIRLLNIQLQKYEEIQIPRGEIWKVSGDEINADYVGVGSVVERYPLLFSGGMKLRGMSSGRITGLAFSKNGTELKINKVQDLTVYLKKDETFTIPKGKFFKGLIYGMDFVSGNNLLAYAADGFVLKTQEKNSSGIISGILCEIKREVENV